MGGIIKLAWRNLGRNRRRTIITGSALAVGMSLCVASFGLIDGMNADILNALTRLDLGHVQVHHPDYLRKRTLRLSMPGQLPALEAAREHPDCGGLTRRVYGFGLASAGSKSAGVQLVGVDPATEPSVTQLHKSLSQGRYLDRAPTPWPTGRTQTAGEKQQDDKVTASAEEAAMAEIAALGAQEQGTKHEPAAVAGSGAGQKQWTRKLAAALNPPPARTPGIFIGVDLARILKLKLGDKLYVMTQTVDGMAAEVYLQVNGIIHTGTATYDRGRVYMHIADLQRFLNLGRRVHEVALLAVAPGRAGALAADLGRRLEGAAVAGPVDATGARAKPVVLAARSWDQLRPDIKSIIQLNSVSTGIMVFIIFIVAALGVINTMLMAVFERTRELGMLKAIGLSGVKVLLLILTETLMLVGLASVAGLGIGLGLDLYMIVYGLDLTFLTEGISFAGVGMKPVIHGAITAEGILVPLFSLGVICLLGAFYPAARAARMRPAQGMREA